MEDGKAVENGSGGRGVAERASLVVAVFLATFEVISIRSILVENPATGSLLWLAILGAAAFVLTRRGADARARSAALARVALTASIAALPLTAVLFTRLGEAQGARPDTAPFVQMVVFLLFQLGLAVTFWLSAVRGRTDPGRFVPGAIGSAVLIVGSFMTTFGGGAGNTLGPSSASAAEPGEVYKTLVAVEDYDFAEETNRVGEDRGAAFAHFHTGTRPLLGVSFGTKEWFGRERIADDLRGVFTEGEAGEAANRFVARPGYAVSALEVQADDYINALRVEFAPFDGGRLAMEDRYWSEWGGSHDPARRTTRLDSGSALVVGFRGAGGMVLNSLSLLVALPLQ